MQTLVVTYPFQIKQVSPYTVEVESMGCLPPFIEPDVLKRAYGWLSDEQIDGLITDLYQKATCEAVKLGVKVQYRNEPELNKAKR